MTDFPDGKRFAFTVFDDTDNSTVANVGPVYDLLTRLGLRCTKSVWPLTSVPQGAIGGASLQETEYLAFVRALQNEGHELALHGARNHDAPRQVVQQGIEEFCEKLGHKPRLHANHSKNRENIYWGAARLSSATARAIYRAGLKMLRPNRYEGHIESSEYFWGDLCRDNIVYVRNFTFDNINTEKASPFLPYHDRAKPFVNYWFSASEGGDMASFCELLSERNQDRLEAESGVCIIYTHFACGFFDGRGLNSRFKQLMQRLARMNGWFMPVGTVLDFLRAQQEASEISPHELAAVERRWLLEKARQLPSRRIKSKPAQA